MNGDQTKTKILNILSKDNVINIKDIAKKVGISPSTASKYLQVLKAEGKVDTKKQLPYTFWSLKKNHKGGS